MASLAILNDLDVLLKASTKCLYSVSVDRNASLVAPILDLFNSYIFSGTSSTNG